MSELMIPVLLSIFIMISVYQFIKGLSGDSESIQARLTRIRKKDNPRKRLSTISRSQTVVKPVFESLGKAF